MSSRILNIEVLVSPDTHSPLRFSTDEPALVAESGESFPIDGGIIYLLPKKVANQETKDKERTGWKKVFEEHEWKVDAEVVLGLPDSADDPYWLKVQDAFPFVEALLGDLHGNCGLDLACGIGWASAKFTQRGARMIAADFNDTIYNGLGAAIRARDAGVYFDAVCCDSESLPIADDSLDFAFISSALHHFTEPVKALKEIHRVLKPGGMLIDICESFKIGFRDEQREQEYEPLVEFRDAGINEQSFTQPQYERMYREAGFNLVTLLPDWDRPVAGAPPSKWRNRRLGERAQDHPRRTMRVVLKYARFPFVLALLRWRRTHLTAVDRIFVATK